MSGSAESAMFSVPPSLTSEALAVEPNASGPFSADDPPLSAPTEEQALRAARDSATTAVPALARRGEGSVAHRGHRGLLGAGFDGAPRTVCCIQSA